jgi:hypothetical protein
MNIDYSIHLEFRGVSGPTKKCSAVLAEATAFPEGGSTNMAATEPGLRWFLAAQRIIVRFAGVLAFICALAAEAPQAAADSADRNDLRSLGTLDAGEKIVAIQLLRDQPEARMPISHGAPDVLLRILVYGSAVVFVAFLIANCLARERRLVAAIQAGTQPRRPSRRVRPASPLLGRSMPIEKSNWQDVQGRGIVTVP